MKHVRADKTEVDYLFIGGEQEITVDRGDKDGDLTGLVATEPPSIRFTVLESGKVVGDIVHITAQAKEPMIHNRSSHAEG